MALSLMPRRRVGSCRSARGGNAGQPSPSSPAETVPLAGRHDDECGIAGRSDRSQGLDRIMAKLLDQFGGSSHAAHLASSGGLLHAGVTVRGNVSYLGSMLNTAVTCPPTA